jgi:hypothetical protein
MVKTFIDGIVKMVGLLGSKPNFFKILTTVIQFLPGLIGSIIDLKSADAKTKVDEFLDALDQYTGTDEGAVSTFPHMPKERQEEFWDAIKLAVKNFAYEELKVDGYYQA